MRMSRLSVAVVAGGVLIAACSNGTTATTIPSTSSTATTTIQATTTTTTTTTQPTTTSVAPQHAPATATIVVVQQDLEALGYFDGTIDGITGEITKAAISAFQADAGIEIDGIFGPQTDAALSAALKRNEEYVTELQEFLVEKKLYPGPIDGDYGKGTKRGVEAFQKSCEIEETGELDIATRLCVAGL
ncbi:MAG: hypothetical protein BMS9Abin20_0006 [Acidimicrobiia bacterium]|nr:MAG: hypothetical protein BMS9Abin20_0006 [Acidimicrobiia bacterium]